MTLNSVHNIKNKEYVQTTCLSLFSIKLVKKMKMTTCHRHQLKLVSLLHYIIRKRQITKAWKRLSRKLKKIYSTLNMLKNHVMNLRKDEKAALKYIRNWDKNVVRVQDKGSRFGQ